MKAKIRQ